MKTEWRSPKNRPTSKPKPPPDRSGRHQDSAIAPPGAVLRRSRREGKRKTGRQSPRGYDDSFKTAAHSIRRIARVHSPPRHRRHTQAHSFRPLPLRRKPPHRASMTPVLRRAMGRMRGRCGLAGRPVLKARCAEASAARHACGRDPSSGLRPPSPARGKGFSASVWGSSLAPTKLQCSYCGAGATMKSGLECGRRDLRGFRAVRTGAKEDKSFKSLG